MPDALGIVSRDWSRTLSYSWLTYHSITPPVKAAFHSFGCLFASPACGGSRGGMDRLGRRCCRDKGTSYDMAGREHVSRVSLRDLPSFILETILSEFESRARNIATAVGGEIVRTLLLSHTRFGAKRVLPSSLASRSLRSV